MVSNIMICVGNYAKNPYYFKKFSVRVWSMEELCHFFISNPFILDQDILDNELADWIGYECGLQDLSHTLHTLLNKAGTLKLFIITILEYTGYCIPKQQEQIERILQDNIGLNDYIKQKNKADYLVKSGKYALALQAYDAILDKLPEAEHAIKADVFHNKGVTYASLFMYEKASDYFKGAYEMAGSKDSLRQMLMAKRQSMGENEYISFIADHHECYEVSLEVEKALRQVKEQFEATQESRMLFALKVYREEGNTIQYYEEIGRQIEKLKIDYLNVDGAD